MTKIYIYFCSISQLQEISKNITIILTNNTEVFYMKKTLQKVLAIVMVLTMLFSQMAIMSSAFESEIASVTIVADGKLIENYDGIYCVSLHFLK